MILKKQLTNQSGFTLVELLVAITIIGIISSIGLNSFTTTQKKSRDAKRKGHLKQLVDSFEAYYNDKEQYPADGADGNVYGCGDTAGDDAEQQCTWGTSKFWNVDNDTIYMIKIPGDPTTGYSYYYDAQSANQAYYLCARLENTNDIDIPVDGDDDPQIYSGTDCVIDNCNYCLSSTNIGLPSTADD